MGGLLREAENDGVLNYAWALAGVAHAVGSRYG
jgi:hypothetical protein